MGARTVREWKYSVLKGLLDLDDSWEQKYPHRGTWEGRKNAHWASLRRSQIYQASLKNARRPEGHELCHRYHKLLVDCSDILFWVGRWMYGCRLHRKSSLQDAELSADIFEQPYVYHRQ